MPHRSFAKCPEIIKEFISIDQKLRKFRYLYYFFRLSLDVYFSIFLSS